MIPSADLLAFLRAWEGLRLKAYDDGGGVWTIGYGHTKGVRKGDTCTVAQAEAWLADEVSAFSGGVDAVIHVATEQHEFDACVSLAYNIGLAAFRDSTLLRKINANLFESAAEQFGRWVYDNGKIVNGLVKRRGAERAMFADGDYSGRPGVSKSPQPVEQIEETAQNVATNATTVAKPATEKPVDPISLVGILASVFAPLLRAKVEKAVGTEVGKPLMDNLLTKAQELTGKADPLEAVAVARNDPAVVAKLEESATDWFAQVAPMMDKLAAMEEREYAMNEDSQDRAAARYKGAEFDPARLLTYFAIGAVAALTLMLGAWITISKFQASPVGIEEWAAFTGLIGWLTAKAGSIYDNRFGTTRQSAAKDVIIGEMARRR